ncbi:MAG: S1C family serine protease, partial [Clostridia bacterium]|nr:S1C family serine protease [Clostridia bacterium]
MDEFNHDNNHTYSEGDVHSVIPNDNSYTSMETPVQSHEQASFTNTNTIEDRYDDLKTSSFYNESYKKPAKGRLKGMLVPLIVVALLSSLLTGGVVGAYFTFGLPHTYNSGTGGYSSPNNTLVKEGTGSSKQIEIVDKSTSVASAVAEKVGPAIVGINVTYQYSDAFFGTQKNQEQGSGIIYRNDGYIITNNHVIESAMLGSSNKTIAPSAKIEVVLPNQEGKPYAATVIGRDPKTDIAVIKINASELPTAVLGCLLYTS